MTTPLDIAPLWFWASVAGLVGLAFGSFSTVLSWRWPRNESVVHPRSHCSSCERTLTPLELVPVLSWVALRGRCRGCGERVHWRYPAIEVASGALAAGAILSFGATWKGLAAALLGVVLVPVIVIDLEHRRPALHLTANPDRFTARYGDSPGTRRELAYCRPEATQITPHTIMPIPAANWSLPNRMSAAGIHTSDGPMPGIADRIATTKTSIIDQRPMNSTTS